VLSQGEPRDAAVNFDTYRSLQQHRPVFTLIVLLKILRSIVRKKHQLINERIKTLRLH